MREPFVTIYGVRVFRNSMVATGGSDRFDPRYCAICEQEIVDGEKVSLLMCNGELFPNVWVHDEHFGDKEQHHASMVRYLTRHYAKFSIQWDKRKMWGCFR